MKTMCEFHGEQNGEICPLCLSSHVPPISSDKVLNDPTTQKWKDETIKQANELAKRENKKGDCTVCGKLTELYCDSCEDKQEDFRLWYCEKHYGSVVLTGNCCSGNEKIYNY